MTCRPGRLVPIGRKVPRKSSGASGFGSKVSYWLGPPQLKIRMTDFAFAARGAVPGFEARAQVHLLQ